jgi:DNA-binding NarL/FixJ family response regulator
VIRVVVADDQVAARAGVQVALNGRGFVVVAEASTAAGAIDAVAKHRPDICLLDIQMPGSGLQAAREIKSRFPKVEVVMLTVSEDTEDLIAALRAGAVGYLLKTTSPSRLPDALRGVLDGEAALPRVLARRLLEEVRPALGSQPKGNNGALTAREQQILDLLREGMTTQEIAESLTVAPVTVRTHVAAILRKLGVTDRKQIAEALRRD